MLRPEITFQKIELTYFTEKKIRDVLIKDIKPLISIQQKNQKKNKNQDIKTAKLEKIKVDLKKNAETKVVQKKVSTTKNIARISNDLQKKKDKITKKQIGDGILSSEYGIKVREKIKAIIEKNKKSFTKEGEVYVKFVIDRNGRLKDVMLYKSSGKNMRSLETIAIESIKQASPFSPFSADMTENELLFKLPIKFTCYP
jgi:TonB family protein